MAPILGTRYDAWPDEAACAAAAARLAAALAAASGSPSRRRGDAFVELHGTLGAGKTTFARHLLHALGVEGTVRSPTYTLLEPYQAGAAHGGFAVSHFDFYRFDDPQEWEDAGFRDVFSAPGLKLVEWPEKAAGLLPVADLRIVIEPDANDGASADRDDEGAADAPRRARLEALTALGLELLR